MPVTREPMFVLILLTYSFQLYSNKSDMWSFGILLWEIYSFGRVPYPRIVSVLLHHAATGRQLKLLCLSLPEQPLADVMKHVVKGYRMEKPEGCPQEIYELMRQAWDSNADRRPTFNKVKQQLAQLKDVEN